MSHFSVAVFSHDGDYDSLLYPYSEQDEALFRPDIAYVNSDELEAGYQEWLEKRKTDEFSQKHSYENAEEWARGWHGYRQFESGAWGYMNNPDAKWDWYQEGGRFDGLPLKPNAGENDEPIRVRDLDLSKDQAAYDRAIEFWEAYVERGEQCGKFQLYRPEYYIETYGTKERYAQNMAFKTPFAFVTPDGEWHERGRMGWFGVNTANKDSISAYNNEYFGFVTDKKNAGCIVNFIDCHI